MAHDCGRDRRAHNHFRRALELSEIGQDRQLSVHILASLSHLAHHNSQPHDAIRLARAGEKALADEPRSPELEARVLAMQAKGFASLQKQHETLVLLERAGKALEGSYSAEPSPWVSHFDEASLASEAAQCMRQLGKPIHSQHHAERIIELRPIETRSHALGQILLVVSLIYQGEPEQACAIGREIIASTQSLGSYLVTQQLRDLQRLLEPYSSTTVVRDFLEFLDEALHQRVWLLQLSTKEAGFSGRLNEKVT